MSMATISRSSTLPNRGHFTGGNITEQIHTVLTERECSIFDKGLSLYHKRRDVTGFVEALSLVLNTNSKRQLLVPIRNEFVKPSDLIKFNELAIKYGIALPTRGAKKAAQKRPNKTESGPKLIEVRRDLKGEWGFSIRGGVDHGIGIFISWVDQGSSAERAGLKIGDYIHRVDNMNLEGLTFTQATQVFRNRTKAKLVITSYGRIPGFQLANRLFSWVDRDGNPTPPPTETETLGMTPGGHIDPTLRKVEFIVDPGRELGITIRGGAEHGLGIYVSKIDPGSVAESNDIKPGDQILEVNRISYINILHPDAAKGLKERREMSMIIKEIGKLPHAKMQPKSPKHRQQWQPSSSDHSLLSQSRSLPSTTKQRKEQGEDTDAHETEISPPKNGVMLKTKTASAREVMNELAQTLLSKTEMTTFTYCITRYEHKQIGVELLVESLFKLLNTNKKMQLISEVRNIINSDDIDTFNELTIRREIRARKNRKGSLSDSESDAPVHLLNGRRIEDEGFLDDIPQRISPTEVPVIFHGAPQTSTPEMLTQTMKGRRLQMHESTNEDDTWDDSLLPPPIMTVTSSMVDEATLQKKVEEAKEEAKIELEEKLKEEFEAKLLSEKETIEAAAREEKQKLEEEIWKQAEEALREELKKESEDKVKKEFEEKLETSIAEERKKTEVERKRREELEMNDMKKNIIQREREEQIRIELEDKLRKQAEERARKDYESRLQRESEEKARLAEEVKSYRVLKDKVEAAQEKEHKLKMAKDMAEQRATLESAEKQKLEAALKEREKELAVEKARQEAAEKERLLTMLQQKDKELEQERNKFEQEKIKLEQERIKLEEAAKASAQAAAAKKAPIKQQAAAPDVDREEERERLEEEERQRQEEEEEEEEELRRQEEKERKEREAKRKEEERKRLEEKNKKAKLEEEKKRRQEEREKARKAEEERLRKLREEEEKLAREEEEEKAKEEEEKTQEEERKAEEERAREEAEAKKKKEEDEVARRKQQRELARRAEEERLRRLREEQDRKAQEEDEEEEDGEVQNEQKDKEETKQENRVTNEGSFFDPGLMDSLVMDIARPSQPPQRTGHVTFEDQNKKKEQKIIENERKLAEQMLAVRLRTKKNEKKEEGRFSFGGYKNLKGQLSIVTVTKVNRKLGIAVDGGSNTKQKAVIVRQIVPDGSAAMTGKGLAVNQQLLAVNGKSLKGLKHKEAVMAIKEAFDIPMQKTIQFDVLTQDEPET